MADPVPSGGDAQPVPGIDQPALEPWFSAHVAGAVPPLRFSIIAGGHSNITYRVDDAAGHVFVLRRPPLGHVLATAHDVAREHRIISAVGPTAVPVPPALAGCPDAAVNGAPFYVMGYVEGHVLATAADVDAAPLDPDARRRLADHVVENLANLHRLDVDAIGLGELARRDGYLDRQLKRWRSQWEQSRTRELAVMDEAYELLAAAKPAQRYTGIVHGDYRLGNMLSRSEGRVAAVLDWELCTLGDVLADVGFLLNNWAEAADSETVGWTEPPPTAAGGFPTRAELTEAYAARSGFDVSGIAYYRAFSHWRLAAIAEGVKRRYMEGVMAGESVSIELYDRRVEEMAREAVRLIRSLN
jgi:aminoglycoside phosphotransferase (APT) family kinase protein